MPFTPRKCVFAVGASVEVLDSDDNLIQKLTTGELSPEATPEGANPNASYSTGLNSAGMQSMTSNVTEDSTRAVCGSQAFLLPLQLGQNDFDIEVTPPEPLDQVRV